MLRSGGWSLSSVSCRDVRSSVLLQCASALKQTGRLRDPDGRQSRAPFGGPLADSDGKHVRAALLLPSSPSWISRDPGVRSALLVSGGTKGDFRPTYWPNQTFH